MPEEVMIAATQEELEDVRESYADEGWSTIETRNPDGTTTIVARKNQANGAPQTTDFPDAVQNDPVAPVDPPPAAGGPQTLGPDGERLIKAFESCARSTGGGSFHPYLDSVQVPTIGWGHTNHLGRQFTMGDVWTQQDCDTAFRNDMRVFESSVRKLVRVQLNPHQFDALVSFCYNCGAGNLAKSTLLKRVNEQNFPAAAQEFMKWVKAGGKTLNGLVRRRKYESRLFQGFSDATYP